MLIGYVLVLVINSATIEPVTEQVVTLEECQAAMMVEKVYHPDSEYGCADVYREEKEDEN